MITDPAIRIVVKQLYDQLLSVVVLLARLLGEPCPVITRKERRRLDI